MKNISHLKFPAFNKKFLIGIISSVLLVIIIGCDDTSTGPDYPDEISYVRVIHQSSAKDQLDITYEWLQSGNRHTLLRDLEYGEQYGYYTFETAPIVFRAYYSNTSVTASVDTLEMEDEKGYTIFVNDLSASINPRLMTFEDTNEQPNAGKVFVRFINLGTDTDIIDVTDADNGVAIITLAKYNASGYVEIEPGTYQFDVFQNGTNILEMNSVTFNENLTYTIVFSGSTTGLIDSPFIGKVYQDTDN